MPAKAPNRLITEKSPYLLQHAYNPVDWYPWGEEAFKKAENEDKPIFLSIGYSTCHWCHVMERESFEDEEVAKLLNETFVCIKVDREERPDVDHVYMTVCQLITQSGGWPLTILMTPAKEPFFAGTYIPKKSAFGRIGMLELIGNVKDLWSKRRSELLQSTRQIMEALKTLERAAPGPDLDASILDKAYQALSNSYDPQWGGFSPAPKFPTPHNLGFLLRYWRRRQEKRALEMVENTLRRMRLGGIYDHLGFGFHRYSTDREWLVPHFEKMLYDQALIATTYLEAYGTAHNAFYGDTAREILDYVIRDMSSSDGGFYSAEDADSEGVEGKFYVWGYQEILGVLGPEAGQLFCKVYNVSPQGNFLEEATKKRTGKNILYLKKEISQIASDLGLDAKELEAKMSEARKKLFQEREKRIKPEKDDKILTDWNALMISAFARGGRILADPSYIETAKTSCDFLLRYLKTDEGRLLHRWLDGEAGIQGMIDDYAFMVAALLDLYEATSEAKYLEEATSINSTMVDLFWDNEVGGFFFTSRDGEKLILRKKEFYDGAIPSGNSVALANLVRLSRLNQDQAMVEMANKLVKAFSNEVLHIPSAYTCFLSSFDLLIGSSGQTGPPLD